MHGVLCAHTTAFLSNSGVVSGKEKIDQYFRHNELYFGEGGAIELGLGISSGSLLFLDLLQSGLGYG